MANNTRIAALHRVVEAVITEDSEAASEHFHDYLMVASRKLIIGEDTDTVDSILESGDNLPDGAQEEESVQIDTDQ